VNLKEVSKWKYIYLYIRIVIQTTAFKK
jgi:hypothetical protein